MLDYFILSSFSFAQQISAHLFLWHHRLIREGRTAFLLQLIIILYPFATGISASLSVLLMQRCFYSLLLKYTISIPFKRQKTVLITGVYNCYYY